MNSDLFLLVSMCVGGSYLLKVAVKVNMNDFQDQAYLEDDNKEKLKTILESRLMYEGPIVEVEEIFGISL